MAYDLFALLTDEATITVAQLSKLLKAKFAPDQGAQVLLESEKSLAIKWKNWAFQIAYEDGPHVLEESREIAELHSANRPDESLIAACRRRMIVVGDPDPNMEHFNDYLFIEEVFLTLPGVILYDPQEKAFVDKKGT